MKYPLTSVIIPTYNRDNFIKSAIDSVLKQNYPNMEIIIVDDGSNDKTKDIIDKYENLIYIYQKNQGVSSARNTGIKNAKGEFLAFLDSDDQWNKNKLNIQIQTMLNEKSDISYTNEIWLRNNIFLNQKKKHKKYNGYIFKHCLPLCIISPSSIIVKKEVFNKIGLFDENFVVCEDYEMWLRMSLYYNIRFIDENLITKYGGHPDQLSHKFHSMDTWRINAMIKLFKNHYLKNKELKMLLKEIIKKSEIYIKGCLKRGKENEIKQFSTIIKTFKKFI